MVCTPGIGDAAGVCKFGRDDLRGGYGSRLLRLLFLPTLPVAATPSQPPLLAVRRSAISPACLPLPPPACLPAALLTAIARQRLLGPEDAPTAFSANRPGSGDGEPYACAREPWQPWQGVDFSEELGNLHQGPWEVPLREAQASKRNTNSPSGHPQRSGQSSNRATLPQDSNRIVKRGLR